MFLDKISIKKFIYIIYTSQCFCNIFVSFICFFWYMLWLICKALWPAFVVLMIYRNKLDLKNWDLFVLTAFIHSIYKEYKTLIEKTYIQITFDDSWVRLRTKVTYVFTSFVVHFCPLASFFASLFQSLGGKNKETLSSKDFSSISTLLHRCFEPC